jgi:putative SOS response-associated peptidase YedK
MRLPGPGVACTIAGMCLLMSIHGPRAVTRAAEIFQVALPDGEAPEQWVASGFDHPRWPVLLAGTPVMFAFPSWGLIPGWVKTAKDAADMRKKTLNARAETIAEKPAFRQAARDGRCLILLDGFFEYHKRGGAAYPFFIHMNDGSTLFVAGLSTRWVNPESGEAFLTFTLITTEANAMMEEIHNEKKRMPAILDPAAARAWLDPSRSPGDLAPLLRSRDIPGLAAHPVSKLLSSRTQDRNVAAVQEPFDYPELSSSSTSAGSAPISES